MMGAGVESGGTESGYGKAYRETTDIRESRRKLLTPEDTGQQDSLFKRAETQPAETSPVDAITRAVNDAYAQLAPLKGRVYDLTDELTMARQILHDAGTTNQTVDHFVRQGALMQDVFKKEDYSPDSVALGTLMEKHADQPGKLTGILKRYAGEVQAVGNPKEMALGLDPKIALLGRAENTAPEKTGGGEGLFAQKEAGTGIKEPQFNEEVHHQAGGYAWWLWAKSIRS